MKTKTFTNTQLNKDSSVKWLKTGLAIVLVWLQPFSSSMAQELFMEGKVSTPYKERDMTISPDGNHLLYSIHSYNDDQRMIVEMKKKEDQWNEPSVVSFSGISKDIEPMFSPDGNRLFFASDRPMFDGDESKDYNIWYVDKIEMGWSSPVSLDTLINTSGEEFFPSVSNNGTLYYTATRSDTKGKEDIYYSLLNDGKFTKPTSLDSAINTATYEFNSFIDPDERYLIFSSYKRPDGFGGGDLYISYKKDDVWQPAVNLGNKINSSKLDYCPFVSADGKTFYFTSSRKDFVQVKTVSELREALNSPKNGFDDIYTVRMDELPR
ncbi:hypothetical protein [Reichenbachiella sp.]|uniref:hypothetical protein n=1 Tax=Reichenbachiella sp. TaxID=2184521 RepID=UPI003BB1F391